MERYQGAITEALVRIFGTGVDVSVHPTVCMQRHWSTGFTLSSNKAIKDVSLISLMAQLKQQLQTKIASFDVTNVSIRFDKDPIVIHIDWTCADAPPSTVPVMGPPSSSSTTTTESSTPLTGLKGLLSQTWNRLWGRKPAKEKRRRIVLQRRPVKLTKVHEHGVVVPTKCIEAINRLRLPPLHRTNLVHLLIQLRAFQGKRTPRRLNLRLREQTHATGRVALALYIEHLLELELGDVQHALHLVQAQGTWTEIRESLQFHKRGLILWFQVDVTHTPESLAMARFRSAQSSAFTPITAVPPLVVATRVPTPPVQPPPPSSPHGINLMESSSNGTPIPMMA